MKRTIIMSLLLLMSSIYSFGQAPKNKIKTDKIHVSGVCNDCKERIENAAYLPGVKRADWNKESKTLTVIYKTSKVSLLEIEKSIANVGYDTGEVKASDSAYNQLPDCCSYRSEEAHTH